MRITHTMIAATSLRNLNTNLARLEESSNQLTSGKRINKPSDDPIAVASAMAHRTTLDQIDQYLKNIDEANAWLEVTDIALEGAGQGLHRARELATAAANDTLSASDRLAIKNEIDTITETMLQLANMTYGDQYVFSGSKTTTPAYSSATPPTYAGNATLMQREIAPGADITVNVVGPAAFAPIFSALNDLSTALTTNDGASIRASLNGIQDAETALLTTRAQVGARWNRLVNQRDRLMDIQVNVTALKSKVEDTDYTQTLMNFSTAETVYKAALQVGARSVQPSLLDYLR